MKHLSFSSSLAFIVAQCLFVWVDRLPTALADYAARTSRSRRKGIAVAA